MSNLTLEMRIINYMRDVAKFAPEDPKCTVRDIWRNLRPAAVGDVLRSLGSLFDDEKLRLHPTGEFTLAPEDGS